MFQIADFRPQTVANRRSGLFRFDLYCRPLAGRRLPASEDTRWRTNGTSHSYSRTSDRESESVSANNYRSPNRHSSSNNRHSSNRLPLDGVVSRPRSKRGRRPSNWDRPHKVSANSYRRSSSRLRHSSSVSYNRKARSSNHDRRASSASYSPSRSGSSGLHRSSRRSRSRRVRQRRCHM
jgi:hypothetical protein